MRSRRASSDAGERLKSLRVQARMTTRDVEGLSLQVSQSKRNPEYYISHAWLTDIENGKFTPSIYKLYTLSAVYGSRFSDMLGCFGLDLSEVGANQTGINAPVTDLLSSRSSRIRSEANHAVPASDNSYLQQTVVVSPVSAASHRLPLSMLQYLNSKNKLLGFVGLQDFTLYPLIRPGSFVEINPRQNKIRPAPWTNEY